MFDQSSLINTQRVNYKLIMYTLYIIKPGMRWPMAGERLVS